MHGVSALTTTTALTALLVLVASWLLIGALGLVQSNRIGWVARTLFPLGALVALGMAGMGAMSLATGFAAQTSVLAFGLPDMPFHVRLDALSGFFLLLLGSAGAGISIFAAGYFRQGEGTAPGLLCLQYHVFLASMALVVLADDAYLFMVAWETMALSSYFLVTTQHRIPEIQRAGFLYLLMAHVGALALLLCFGVLHGGSWLMTFDSMRAATLSPAWAAAAFLLALFGFGAKAGLVPLHVWLPEAHPAAPSPVSAMMSGLMLKVAVYGMLRISFDLLHAGPWWWGMLTLAVGLATALFGAVFAAVQTDMKRLLAYSSIENIGLIFAALGLALLCYAFDMRLLAALALTAALLHALNHALFKSLLFLATGSVLHATHERSLGKLGGLIRRMPWVATLALVGTLSLAGLPPLNGFVSEWLLLQAFLSTPSIPHAFINMIVPLGAAVVALTAALAGYVMVKFYGVIFLGQPREPSLMQAHDAGWLERVGLAWLALGCILIGVFPQAALDAIAGVTQTLLGTVIQRGPAPWWIAPVAQAQASYSGLWLLLGMAGVIAVMFVLVRRMYHGRVRRVSPWNCGYPELTPRMQDTAEGFGQPIRHMFGPFFRIEREVPSPDDQLPRYRIQIDDHLWHGLYLPLARIVGWLADALSVLQRGRLAIYLLYSFLTLIVLLVFVL
ncbi:MULTISPECIES: hydrogenase 4 subunit B [Rhodanobacter]|uniref:Formate hydrogenlyase subunit 3/multisubunit Na+/H+ antiporter, MnhD subunit n=1 Tax=Rhodanobacter denitrificans TaxID=666685 RepID=M4NNL2_9GAMM|nr:MULTISPECIES: hydrogenase 4 subunit B [Rhodanobacter]AGG89281.1 formate hydrogenlyase subunit 3/multisubunit Na+/H+ antiporter, MnhD subunit [Rhodanobacter denitrificans]